MSTETHNYELSIEWKGNKGSGTFDYRSYGREHTVSHHEKQQSIKCSSDPAYRGDVHFYNPEELFIASVANCQMLWYLHLCAVSEVVVTHYEDKPHGVLSEENGIMKMTKITLRPRITITESSSEDIALALIDTAHTKCFIANSINVPITIDPTIKYQ